MTVGVQVTREGSGLSLPASLGGTTGTTSGDNVDWEDGTGAPGSIPGPAGNFELKIEGGQSVIKAHGSMGATATFDPTDGNVHTGTLNANCTFTLNAPTGTGFCSMEFWLSQDGTGGWVITWPGTVTEIGTQDTTASTTSRVVVETVDAGTSWLATWVGSSDSSGGMVPYYIAPGATFTVPLYYQALYTIPIDVDGTLAINGILAEVN